MNSLLEIYFDNTIRNYPVDNLTETTCTSLFPSNSGNDLVLYDDEGQYSINNVKIIATEPSVNLVLTADLNENEEDFMSILVNDENEGNSDITETNNDEDYNPRESNDTSSEDDQQTHLEVNDEVEEKNRGRKRKRTPQAWKKNIRKRKRAGGKEYLSSKNKIVKKRELKEACSLESCKLKCRQKISDEERQGIYQQFWNYDNTNDQKRQFICSSIEEKPIQRLRSRTGESVPKRKHSLLYFFSINGERTRVCQKYFLSTLSISQSSVRIALQKRTSGGIVTNDQRGKHTPANKLSNDARNKIRHHIMRFPTLESHYSREKTKKVYLGIHLNISRMYEMFREECQDNNMHVDEIPKQWLYSHIFNTEFNLGFQPPSSDTCDQCDAFQIQLKGSVAIEQRNAIQKTYDKHLSEAQSRYTAKKIDKEQSKANKSLKVLMVDLQKCLPSPVLTNAQSFYSLKLWSFNYTIYDSSGKIANCMMWDESIAGRGGNEMASCLLKYVMTLKNNDPEVTHLIIWSDNCPSQNRNIHMIMCYFFILHAAPQLKVIEHKYLLRGHTHMEADMVHSLIERESKKLAAFSIMWPWDWQQIARMCGNRLRFDVTGMESEDFKSFNKLCLSQTSPYISQKKTENNTKFLISQMVHFKVTADTPGILYCKTSLDDDNFEAVNFNRKTAKQCDYPAELTQLMDEQHPISKKKYEDLQNLLRWVPKRFHQFYKDLRHD